MKHFTPLVALFVYAAAARGAENWPQLQGDALRSGNAPVAAVKTPLGLVGAVPLTDGIYAAPVVSDGKAIVMDGSGVVVTQDGELGVIVCVVQTLVFCILSTVYISMAIAHEEH